MGASGKRRARESRTFSPPRMPVSQSWTSATFTPGPGVRGEGSACFLGGGDRSDRLPQGLEIARVDGAHGALPAEGLHAGESLLDERSAESGVAQDTLEAAG